MRLAAGQSLYTLEVHPAGYAAIAANEAEKRAAISVLELVTFGAVGRLWLGGGEEEIQQAARAVDETLAGLAGRPERRIQVSVTSPIPSPETSSARRHRREDRGASPLGGPRLGRRGTPTCTSSTARARTT